MSLNQDAVRSGWKAGLERTREALKVKCELLTNAFKLNVWRTQTGVIAPEQAIEQQSGWPEQQLVYTWAPRDGDRMFYRQIQIPASYMGISLLASEVTLEIWMNTGATVYVNGKTAYQANYWADTQVVPIELTKSAGEDESFHFFIQCRQGDGFGYFPLAEVRIAAIDEWIFQLDTFHEELGFIQFLIENGDIRDEAIISSLDAALDAFDYEALDRNNWERVQYSIEQARSKLAVVQPYAKAYQIHLIAHAHIDMNWLWPWSETVSLIIRDFEAMLDIMEQYPQVCFSHSQAATYRVVQELVPDLWDRMMRQVKRGAWEVTASTWVEGDLNMSGYETLIRQFVEGKTYARQHLGVDPIVCWEPDTFGHPATMPHVLTRAGIKYYYHTRGGRGMPLYWWEGAEGSRVLVFNDPSSTGYNGRIFASHIVSGSIEMRRSTGLKTNMYVYGIGDHGGGATRQDVIRAIRLDESPLLPRFTFSKAVDFFCEIEQSGCAFPVFSGELNPVFAGCYTSHGDIKRANRQTEHALVRAETLAAIADTYSLVQGKTLQGGWNQEPGVHALREAWRRQCFNQFHDILCGCSIKSTYLEALPAAEEARLTAEGISSQAIRSMHPAASSTGRTAATLEPAIVVYNTLSWKRTDVVVLRREEYPETEAWQDGDMLADPDGRTAEIQCTGNEIIFVARNVPACGFVVYRYCGPADSPQPKQPIQWSFYKNPVLEIGRYRVEVDHESGTIIDLTDKNLSKQYAYPNEWTDRFPKGKLNVLEIYDEVPHGMSAWIIGTVSATERLISGAQVRVLHEGPVFQSVEVIHRCRESEIRQEIRVYRELDRIDFPTTVEWNGQGSGTKQAPMLKVLFTPAVRSVQHTANIPFGAIERPADGSEMPALHWIDVSEGKDGRTFGMSLLNNSKYGHSIQGNTMAITLIRSSYEPDNTPDIGHHQFTYSAYPHAGDWREAHTDRRGWELNQPLTAAAAMTPGSLEAGQGSFSALCLEELTAHGWEEASGTIVTAFKPSGYSGSGEAATLIRLARMHGNADRLRIVMPAQIARIEETDLLETAFRTIGHGADGSIDIGSMKEGEIRSFLVYNKPF
ncbi:alpha-mannosidase [Paenibacillus sp. GCM10027626]|uniref:alpha-mannosidase n=1 Tax=Paenibacillus sp. GCM10027626 TaxID=3273411 RepID=UPI003624FF35